MPRVFVSHSRHDRALVEKELISPLKQNGIDVFYAPHNLRAGQEWEREIFAALDSCEWFLVVMTSNAAASQWVRREVHWATERRDGKIVTAVFDEVKPDKIHLGLLAIQHVDFATNAAKARADLIKLWKPETPSNIANPQSSCVEEKSISDPISTISSTPWYHRIYCNKCGQRCMKFASGKLWNGRYIPYKIKCARCNHQFDEPSFFPPNCVKCGNKRHRGGYCYSCGA